MFYFSCITASPKRPRKTPLFSAVTQYFQIIQWVFEVVYLVLEVGFFFSPLTKISRKSKITKFGYMFSLDRNNRTGHAPCVSSAHAAVLIRLKVTCKHLLCDPVGFVYVTFISQQVLLNQLYITVLLLKECSIGVSWQKL